MACLTLGVMCVDDYPCGRLRQNNDKTEGTRTLIHEETAIRTHGNANANVSERNITAANSTNSPELNSATISSTLRENQWDFFPTLPTVIEETRTDQRIVGGSDAKPGEIPWQVNVCVCVGARMREI